MQIPYPKIRYYLLFFYYKLRIIFDCLKGRKGLYIAELVHLWNSFHTKKALTPENNTVCEIQTIFGTYIFVGDEYGYGIVSPAFERQDKEYEIQAIKKSLAAGRRVLFLDIGANVGVYSVGLSKFIKSKRFTIAAIEPDPVYHKLLLENIRRNNTRHITVYNVALGDRDKTIKTTGLILTGKQVAAATVPVKVRRLDSIMSQAYFKRFDEIFVKIDIEGAEIAALQGARNLMASGKRVQLMIEDCIKPSIIRYLAHHGWRFAAKMTPYNSFWLME